MIFSLSRSKFVKESQSSCLLYCKWSSICVRTDWLMEQSTCRTCIHIYIRTYGSATREFTYFSTTKSVAFTYRIYGILASQCRSPSLKSNNTNFYLRKKKTHYLSLLHNMANHGIPNGLDLSPHMCEITSCIQLGTLITGAVCIVVVYISCISQLLRLITKYMCEIVAHEKIYIHGLSFIH